jgi:hypothetical protein
MALLSRKENNNRYRYWRRVPCVILPRMNAINLTELLGALRIVLLVRKQNLHKYLAQPRVHRPIFCARINGPKTPAHSVIFVVAESSFRLTQLLASSTCPRLPCPHARTTARCYHVPHRDVDTSVGMGLVQGITVGLGLQFIASAFGFLPSQAGALFNRLDRVQLSFI